MHLFYKRLVQLKNVVIDDIVDKFKFDNSYQHKLDMHQKEKLDLLKRDGVVIIKGFLDKYNCKLLQEKIFILFKEHSQNYDFQTGAYLRNLDFLEYDKGVSRIHHIEKEIKELTALRFNTYIENICSAYLGKKAYSQILIAQHNVPGKGLTREYHVDQFGKQLKTFLYLEDVREDNGPFTYIKGSHKNIFIRLKKLIIGNSEGRETTFYLKDLKSILHREVKLYGEAGDLIIADVRGIHRGSPQVSASRTILMNYIYPKPGDRYPDK